MDNMLDMFGLSDEQLEFMYSLEYLVTMRDIANEKSVKAIQSKSEWLNQWWRLLMAGGLVNHPEEEINETNLVDVSKEIDSKCASEVWFYMVLLETVTFSAYFPLEEGSTTYSRLRYKLDKDYLTRIVALTGIGKPEYVERFDKTYKSSYKVLLRDQHLHL